MNERKINVLFVLADDMGLWAWEGAGNREIRTPHLNALASEGATFENMFCVSPVCSPARASIVTGAVPSVNGVLDWIREGNSRIEGDGRLIDYLASQPTVHEAFAGAGYDVALSGKWHLGNVETPAPGYRHWYAHAKGGSNYFGAPMFRNGELYEEPGYLTDAITADVVAFLEKERAQDRPFHLNVHYTAPHSPWDREQHLPELYDDYHRNASFDDVPGEPVHPLQINTCPVGHDAAARRDLLSGYYASITAMDVGIGRIVKTLERIGELDNTLIIFTSDNGMNMGHHGIWGKGNGTYPQNMYDTSVKVPCIIRWPGVTKPGSKLRGLYSHYDFFPTFMNLLERPMPPGNHPGRTLRGSLEKEEAEDGAVVVFDEYGPVRMLRTRDWKYVISLLDGAEQLFDLRSDPDERSDLARDPQCAPQREKMRRDLDEWFAKYGGGDRLREAALEVRGKGQLRLPTDDGAFATDMMYFRNVETEDS